MIVKTVSRAALVITTLGLILSWPVPAAAARQIDNIEDSPIAAGLTLRQVESALVSGGHRRGWVVEQIEPGYAQATLFVRSHMARVDIRFSRTTYSIHYSDSINLGHRNGKIHRNYNKWVRNLNMDIQRALTQPER